MMATRRFAWLASAIERNSAIFPAGLPLLVEKSPPLSPCLRFVEPLVAYSNLYPLNWAPSSRSPPTDWCRKKLRNVLTFAFSPSASQSAMPFMPTTPGVEGLPPSVGGTALSGSGVPPSGSVASGLGAPSGSTVGTGAVLVVVDVGVVPAPPGSSLEHARVVRGARASGKTRKRARIPRSMAHAPSGATRNPRRATWRVRSAPTPAGARATEEAERRHQELLDGVLAQLARLLGQDSVQDAITETIAREIRALKYVGLDQVAARLATRKVVVVVARTIIDMADDPAHSLRQRFDDMVEGYVTRLKDEPALRERGERLKRELLDNPALGAWVNQLWSELLAWLQADMAHDDSSIRRTITQAARATPVTRRRTTRGTSRTAPRPPPGPRHEPPRRGRRGHPQPEVLGHHRQPGYAGGCA